MTYGMKGEVHLGAEEAGVQVHHQRADPHHEEDRGDDGGGIFLCPEGQCDGQHKC